MTSWRLTLWSLNHPGISTLQPYSPPSLHRAFRTVRDTSPSATLPSSWYLGDCLNSTAPSTERMVLEHLDLGTFARPQQKDREPWAWASYLQGSVTLSPYQPVTVKGSEDTGKDTADVISTAAVIPKYAQSNTHQCLLSPTHTLFKPERISTYLGSRSRWLGEETSQHTCVWASAQNGEDNSKTYPPHQLQIALHSEELLPFFFSRIRKEINVWLHL